MSTYSTMLRPKPAPRGPVGVCVLLGLAFFLQLSLTPLHLLLEDHCVEPLPGAHVHAHGDHVHLAAGHGHQHGELGAPAADDDHPHHPAEDHELETADPVVLPKSLALALAIEAGTLSWRQVHEPALYRSQLSEAPQRPPPPPDRVAPRAPPFTS